MEQEIIMSDKNNLLVNLGHPQNYIDNNPDLICISSPDWFLTYANDSFLRFFGITKKDLAGKNLIDFICPDDQHKFSAYLKTKKDKTRHPAALELRSSNADGQLRWIQWMDNYLVPEDSPNCQIISIGRDISSLRKTNHQLQHQINLERLVTGLSIDFINIDPEQIDQQINHVLKKVGEFTQINRSYLFVFVNNFSLVNTHEWCSKGIDPQKRNFRNFSPVSLPWLLDQLNQFRSVHIPDVYQLPEDARSEQNFFIDLGIKSLLIVPVTAHNQLIGFVGFDSVLKHKSWTGEEVTILNIVGKLFGNALDQKRTHQQLDLHRAYLEKLNKLTIESLNSTNVNEMLDIVADQIGDLILSDNCSINLWDEKSQTIYASAYNGEFADEYKNFSIGNDEVSMTASVLKSGEPIIVDDVSTSPYVNLRIAAYFPTRSLLGIPMITNGSKHGSILFGFTTPHQFSVEEITIAKQATAQVAQALHKINILEQAQRSAEEAETLLKVGKIVASTLDPDTTIERILDQLKQAVPYDRATVQILDRDMLEIKASRGWPANISPTGTKIHLSEDNPSTSVIKRKKVFILNNNNYDEDILENDQSSRLNSWIGIPLVVREQIIGMLTLENQKPSFYDDQKFTNLATAFADLVAISLENARLFAEERQRVRELDALRATTADITKELSFERLLESILQRAISLLNATGGELGLVDDQEELIEILISRNVGTDTTGSQIKKGEGLMGYVLLNKKIEMVENYAQWDKRIDSYNNHPIYAAMAAPMMIGNRFLGVIGITNSDYSRRFTNSEKSLLNLFAQQASIAVENARLFEERERQARIDPVTNIYNRRGLYELGTRELDRVERYNRPLAAIMLDIDHFKEVNDTHGHATGDLILKELANRLDENLRKIDILSRYGGEEFVILLPETDEKNALMVAQRLRNSVEEEPFTPNDLNIAITVSLGVSLIEGNHTSLDTLIEQADTAMYQSKSAGRNRVTIYR